ncbi:MAG: rhodanese-like domain-containing protein [Deltaproteobacteria bacterium]|nr:rhodanese-like domain-containing protein [Deltaproteobacteria bacterium]
MVLGFSVWQGSQRSASAHSEAHRLVEAGAILVDVRTTQEFAAGHIPGAIHIPVHEIERRSNELGAKDKPIVVYCRSGNRSASATRMLKARGFTQIYDLGAMDRW